MAETRPVQRSPFRQAVTPGSIKIPPITELETYQPSSSTADGGDRWWWVIAVSVLGAWGGLSFAIYVTVGWWAVAALLGASGVATVATAVLFRGGRGVPEQEYELPILLDTDLDEAA